MSFRERSAWIALIAYTVVFGSYFCTLWQGWDESSGQGLGIGVMVGAVAMLVIIAATLSVVAALLNAVNVPADERERLIELKAERTASYTLSVGAVCLIGPLLIGWNGILVANLLLAALVISELVKAAAQIVYFRAGV